MLSRVREGIFGAIILYVHRKTPELDEC
jgi:hypothetical protein